MINETVYNISNKYNICLAVLADIHFRKVDEFIPLINNRHPDYILIPGDLFDGMKLKQKENNYEYIIYAIKILNSLSNIAPTYMSLGNHEKWLDSSEIDYLKNANAILLDNMFNLLQNDVYIGGLTSGKNYKEVDKQQVPDLNFVKKYDEIDAFKILLCHHPEYYSKYLLDTQFDVIISGHAHGGQIRIGNQGLYAPGQGIFPKYTSGIHDGRLIISRGIAGTERVPRINNKPEILYINL